MSLHIIVDSDGSFGSLIRALHATLAQWSENMSAIDNLNTAIGHLTDAVQSAANDLTALSDALKKALESGDPAAIDAAAQQIEQKVADLNAAVQQNQPPAPPPAP